MLITDEKLFSDFAQNRLGHPCPLGKYEIGFSRYGDQDIFFARSELGAAILGHDFYSDIILLSGIYQKRHSLGRTILALLNYYIPKNPQTEPQQAQRQKLTDGNTAWHALTNEQKKLYNKNAKGRHMTGYNFFLREYLLSH
jgi:hypothetical protein